MLEHKIKPHYYCLPILKREEDRKGLLSAAFNVNKKFFMGTDLHLTILKIKKLIADVREFLILSIQFKF